MPANTPNYTIPYPVITDFVKDGATAMENIAERVDDVLFAQIANRNLLYNGAMQIAQRSTSAVTGITTAGYYTLDRWSLSIGTLGTWTMLADTDVPTGSGFRRSLKMTCTTSKTTLVTTDEATIDQRLEGQDLQAIRKGTASAKTMTLSFWVKGNKTGTYIVMLYDLDNSRFASKSYTINSLNTWEYKTITIPADTTGAFDNDSNGSLLVRWYLAAGPSYRSGTLQQTWGTDTIGNRAVGQTNLADTVNNYINITGTMLTIGTAEVPFQFKSYQQDLSECQRYYWKWVSKNSGDLIVSVYQPASSPIYALIPMPVTMRARPTSASVSGTWTVINSSASPTVYDRGDSWLMLNSSVNAAIGATNQSGFFSTVSSSTLIQDAELT